VKLKYRPDAYSAGLEAARGCGGFREAWLDGGSAESSHIILTKTGHIATLSVPNHPEVARGTLRSLITKSGITVEEFLHVL